MKIDQRLIDAANESGHKVLGLAAAPAGINTRPGVLCAANEQSFNDSFFSVPLTTFVAGMPDMDNVQAELDFLCPSVPCGRRFEYRTFGNVQQVLSETDDARGSGANFKVVELKGELESGRTVNKGLAFIGDLDILAEVPDWEQRYAGWLRTRCMRNDLRRAYTALLALHAGTAAKWATDAATDPTVDLLDLVEAVGDSAGMDANAIVVGRTAWTYGLRNLRAKANPALSMEWTPQGLADMLGVDEVRKSKARYATGTGSKSRMLAAYAVAFHRSSSPVMEDPSSLKRFVTTSQGAAAAAAGVPAGPFQVYRRELSAKLVELSVGHYSNIVGLGAARRLNIE